MRKIIFLIMFITICFSEIIEKEKAFILSVFSNPQGIELNFDIDESVYLYKDKIQVLIENSDITELLNFPLHESKDEREIYKNNLKLYIPKGLINSFSKNEIELFVSFQGCSQNGFCYQPVKNTYNIDLNANSITKQETKKDENIQNNTKEQDDIFNKNAFLILLSFFGYGLLLSLTPCVFPMIPILATIIVAKTKDSNTKNGFFIGLIYVLSVAFTYAVAGVIAAFVGLGIQSFLQIPAVIIATALIFVLLAFGMFGFYSFEIPQSLQNKLNKNANKHSGIIGVIFLGILSALIVGPCTAAPLVGALIYIAQEGNAVFGGLLLFVMGLGMGIPLLLVSLSSKFLPKPGFWMNEIKKAFGFIMLFMAIWMLSRILPNDISLFLYGLLCVFVSAYFGLFYEANNGFKIFMKAVSIIILTFGIVIIGNFAFNLTNNSFQISTNTNKNTIFHEVSDLHELKNTISNSNKPVLVDFWATWCANCKDVEKVLNNANLDNFLVLKVDLSNNTQNSQNIQKEFNVFGPPTVIFFKNGLEFHRIIGTFDKNELEKIIK